MDTPFGCTKIKINLERGFDTPATFWARWEFYQDDQLLERSSTTTNEKEFQKLLEGLKGQGFRHTHMSTMREYVDYIYER